MRFRTAGQNLGRLVPVLVSAATHRHDAQEPGGQKYDGGRLWNDGSIEPNKGIRTIVRHQTTRGSARRATELRRKPCEVAGRSDLRPDCVELRLFGRSEHK